MEKHKIYALHEAGKITLDEMFDLLSIAEAIQEVNNKEVTK